MSDDARANAGGYEQDLRDAENAMIAAGHPDVALQMRRHSEAIRNYMQGAIVPMFVAMVERALGPKIEAVGIGVEGLRTEVATRLGKIEADMRGLNKRHGAQIKALALDVAAIKDVLAARPAQRADEQALRERQHTDLALRISALEDNNIRLEALEDAIAALRSASLAERDHA